MNKKSTVLVVHDNDAYLKCIERIVKKLARNYFAVHDAADVARVVFTMRPTVVVLDLHTSERAQILQHEILATDPNITVIVLAADGTVEAAVRMIKAGAFDYMQTPVSPRQLEVCIKSALSQRAPANGEARPRQDKAFHNIIGQSKVMRDIYEQVKKISKFDVNVLIYGESGTGKELLARSVHANSRRHSQAFVPIDCVAMPESLLESELFGYEKGAFTGASTKRKGLLELANEGTLFLDEICELAPNFQAKLLRVLQEREFRRVGGKDLIKVDLRIISATNRDPAQATKDYDFREDLYYRLNVIPLELPPLRQRKEDIPLLVNYYLKNFDRPGHSVRKKIDPAAMDVLVNYHWPGNVRELRNVVERLVSMSEGTMIRESDLPTSIRFNMQTKKYKYQKRQNATYMKTKQQVMQEFEKEYFSNLLKTCEGNVSKAARLAGVSRITIYRMINSYDLHQYTEGGND